MNKQTTNTELSDPLYQFMKLPSKIKVSETIGIRFSSSIQGRWTFGYQDEHGTILYIKGRKDRDIGLCTTGGYQLANSIDGAVNKLKNLLSHRTIKKA